MVRCSKFGITPAWAGKSLFPAGNALCPWDHPRVGGEKSLILATRTALMGSPPRGRGKGDTNYKIPRFFGITPAWAGKSFCRHSHVIQNADHPRVGGEKTKGGGPEKSGLGSPPRGRGKVGHSVISTISSGITPAWAGKSLFDMVINSLLEDHPRVGGEKPMSLRAALAPPGSPPRGRGKEEDESFAAHAARITPAWAGKRSLRLRHRCPGRDHPRVGGEKTKKIP